MSERENSKANTATKFLRLYCMILDPILSQTSSRSKDREENSECRQGAGMNVETKADIPLHRGTPVVNDGEIGDTSIKRRSP